VRRRPKDHPGRKTRLGPKAHHSSGSSRLTTRVKAVERTTKQPIHLLRDGPHDSS